jgi:hypothetical protein
MRRNFPIRQLAYQQVTKQIHPQPALHHFSSVQNELVIIFPVRKPGIFIILPNIGVYKLNSELAGNGQGK